MSIEPPSITEVRADRFKGFSDGVYAIAITLLVLDLAIAPGSGDRLLQAVLDQWPSYLGYLISYFTIGAAWTAHIVINEYLAQVDSVLLRLNVVHLFFVAFLAFPTRLVAEYVREAAAERVAVTFYGACLLAMNLTLTAMWRYLVATHQIRADADARRVRALTDKLTPSPGFYVVALGVGLLLPIAAVALYSLIAVYLFLPLRLFGRLRRRQDG